MPFALSAQSINVTGTVVDSTGEPIPGATVAVKDSKTAVITDTDGVFKLNNINSGKQITVTFVGMEPVTAKAEPTMHITLRERSEMLDEVVVVAFGKQKREAFTGSAAVVKGDEIVMRQANNPISALEGKVPGMSFLTSSNPASDATINIRGLGSINASTAPLIVLDGQPYDGSWRDISPADVEKSQC